MTPRKKKSKPTFVPSNLVKKRISDWEGIAMTDPSIDPLSKKMVGKNKSFESEADSFVTVLPLNIRDKVLSNQELADNLYSYSYNVGAGKFKERVIPALNRYFRGEGSVGDILASMWAHGDKKLRGLAKRRAVERAGVEKALSDMNPSMSKSPYQNAGYNYYRANQLGYTPDETGHMPSRDYVTGMYLKSPTHPTVMKSVIGDIAEGYNPYYNSEDGLLYSDTFILPSFEEFLNNISTLNPVGYKDGKLPKYGDGTKYVQAGKDNSWSRITSDDMSDAFQNIVARPRSRGGNTTVGNWNRQWSLKGEPGLEIVSPEFDLLSGVRGLLQMLTPKKQIEHIDLDRLRTTVAKLKSDDDVWRAAHPEMEIKNVLKRPKLPNAYETIPKNLQKYEIDPVTQKLVTKQEADLIEKMLYENKGFHGKQISNLHDNRARVNGDFVKGVGRVYNVDDPTDYEAALLWLEDNAFGNRDGAIKFLKHPNVLKSLSGYMLNYKDKPVFISKSQLISRKEGELGRKLTQEEAEDLYYKVVSHERHHAFDKIHNTPEGFDLSNLGLNDYFVKDGFDELAARGTLLKDMFGLVYKPLTGAHLRYAAGKYFMDPSNLNNNMTRFFNIITDYEKAAKWLNLNATSILPITAIGGAALNVTNTQNELRNK